MAGFGAGGGGIVKKLKKVLAIRRSIGHN